MTPIGAAVIGTRGVGALHVRALAEMLGVELRAVVGATVDSSRRAAERFGVPGDSNGVAGVMARDDIDVVHVCTPNDLHGGIAGAALRQGKHVVCEKPLAHTTAAGRALVEEHRRSSVTAVVCYPYRFLPLVQRLRRLVLDDSLGPIHGVRLEYLQNWMLSADSSWRHERARVGASRVLSDIGTHVLDLIEFVTGAHPNRVAADFMSSGGGTSRSDDQVHLLLGLSNGASATVALSQVSAAHLNRLTIALDGANGSARWSADSDEQLVVVSTGGAGALRLDDDAPVSSEGRFWTNAIVPGSTLRALLDTAYRSIRNGRPSVELPSFEDGQRHLELIEIASIAVVQPDLRPVIAAPMRSDAAPAAAG